MKDTVSKPTSSVMVTTECDSADEECVCPTCEYMYGQDESQWICCDACDTWYHLKCTSVNSSIVPKYYYCEKCS